MSMNKYEQPIRTQSFAARGAIEFALAAHAITAARRRAVRYARAACGMAPIRLQICVVRSA